MEWIKIECLNEELLYKKSEESLDWRLYELHSGDVFYCNVDAIKELGYDYDLILGDVVYLGSVITDPSARVVKVIKNNKHTKKWWQFWIKQQEKVTGYNLMVI